MSFLMRVRVPDEPGALGLLATALGETNVDILISSRDGFDGRVGRGSCSSCWSAAG